MSSAVRPDTDPSRSHTPPSRTPRRRRPSGLPRALPLLCALLLVIAVGIVVDARYLLEQGVWAAHYTFSARRLSDVSGPGADAGTQAFFDRVRRIRRYAVDELGLEETDSYTTYVTIDRDNLVYVVSAAGELSFERYRWWYPLVGRLPYRGFYELEGARREAAELATRGYDTLVRRVDAYSSLGFVSDPLYSFMREYSEFALAELIIHEMAHATVFVSGRAAFNEEFATLVGREGALSYLRDRYDAASPQYLETVRRLRDRRVFLAFVATLRNRLARLYDADLPPDEARTEKARVISESQRSFARNADRWFLSDRYAWFAEAEIDNALIDLYATYNAGRMEGYSDDSSPFEDAFRRLGRSIPALVEAVRAAAASDDPEAALNESRDSALPRGGG